MCFISSRNSSAFCSQIFSFTDGRDLSLLLVLLLSVIIQRQEGKPVHSAFLKGSFCVWAHPLSSLTCFYSAWSASKRRKDYSPRCLYVYLEMTMFYQQVSCTTDSVLEIPCLFTCCLSFQGNNLDIMDRHSFSLFNPHLWIFFHFIFILLFYYFLFYFFREEHINWLLPARTLTRGGNKPATQVPAVDQKSNWFMV